MTRMNITTNRITDKAKNAVDNRSVLVMRKCTKNSHSVKY